MHFQLPSGCFFQISKIFPTSVIGLPLSSFAASEYVPYR